MQVLGFIAFIWLAVSLELSPSRPSALRLYLSSLLYLALLLPGARRDGPQRG